MPGSVPVLDGAPAVAGLFDHGGQQATQFLEPLPADGAVSGFRFVVDGVETVGRVETLAAAREAFEEALVEGRTAALLEQDRSSLFTQEVGNIPPGATVVVRLDIDQRLVWRDEAREAGWHTTDAPQQVSSSADTAPP